MHIKLFAGACLAAAAVFVGAPALADPSATIQAGYDYSTSSVFGQSFNTNGGNIAGNIDFPVVSNWTVQVDAAYQGQSTSITGISINAHVTDGGLSAFYSGAPGRLGAMVGTGAYSESITGSGTQNLNATYYGLFGDWYASEHLTVSARGGGISGNNGLGTSSYLGAKVTGYLPHDIALNGSVDYIALHGTSVTDTMAGISGEWLVSHQTPFAITAGWTNSQLKEFGTTLTSNTFSIGGKFYFGAGMSLKERQRSGAETWGATSPLHSFFIF